MKRIALYHAIFSFLLLVGFPSCEKAGSQKKKEADYLAKEERIPIPGTRYDSVMMYDHDPAVYKAEEVNIRAELGRHTWELYALERKEPGLKLFPAHHADLNVALWHQVEDPDPSRQSFIPQWAFVYYHQEVEVGGLLVDHLRNAVWPMDRKRVFLSESAMERIVKIHEELKNPLNQ